MPRFLGFILLALLCFVGVAFGQDSIAAVPLPLADGYATVLSPGAFTWPMAFIWGVKMLSGSFKGFTPTLRIEHIDMTPDDEPGKNAVGFE